MAARMAFAMHFFLIHNLPLVACTQLCTRNVYMCACAIMNVMICWDNCVPQTDGEYGGYKRSGVLAMRIKVFTPLTTGSYNIFDIALRPTLP